MGKVRDIEYYMDDGWRDREKSSRQKRIERKRLEKDEEQKRRRK